VPVRFPRLWTMLLGLCLGAVAGAAEQQTIAAAQALLVHDLAQQLEAKDSPDMNRVASLVFVLADHLEPSSDGPSRRVLERVRDYVVGRDTYQVACNDLSDFYLAATFLGRAGLAVDVGDMPQRLARCLEHASDFALSNALILIGRYRLPSAEGYKHRVVASVEARQQPNGSFHPTDGPNGFYETSHAVLGLYYCGGDPKAIAKGQTYLLDHLPDMQRIGFLDGLAETLIFLKWMGVEVPGEADYRSHLLAQVRPDGGLCQVQRAGCESDWHATSLLYELLQMP